MDVTASFLAGSIIGLALPLALLIGILICGWPCCVVARATTDSSRSCASLAGDRTAPPGERGLPAAPCCGLRSMLWMGRLPGAPARGRGRRERSAACG